MWLCSNCQNEIADEYVHCWNCGAKRVVTPPTSQAPREVTSVPQFGSYEAMVKEPRSHGVIWRRGPLNRIAALLMVGIVFVIFKLFDSPLLAKYGIYIVLVVGGLALVIILWRSFRRDSSEGVGIKIE